jgi:acid phosphatase type 7
MVGCDLPRTRIARRIDGRVLALTSAVRRATIAASCLVAVLGLLTTSSASAAATTKLRCFGKAPTIIGTPGNDRLRGTDKPDVIMGLGGNDTIVGLGGGDRICGGAGKDRIYAGAGFDLIDGGLGVDYCQAGSDARVEAGCELPALSPAPKLPMRVAALLTGYPALWGGGVPRTRYQPTAGFYSSGSLSTIARQLRALAYAKVALALVPWSGATSPSDARLSDVLSESQVANGVVRVALSDDREVAGNPSVKSLRADLRRIIYRFGHDPAYLRFAGKPVIFVRAGMSDGCAMVHRWHDAAAASVYLVMPAFTGWEACATIANSWYRDSPGMPTDDLPGESFSISPGAWTSTSPTPTQPRDLTVFAASVRQMVASGEPWQIVSSFNDWIAGTAVESGGGWESGSGFGTYVDALHIDGAGLAPAPTDPLIAAAGNIACDTADPSFAGGAGTAQACQMASTSALVDPTTAAVLTLGDAQDDDGSLYNYQHAYGRSWGRLLSLTHPVPGSKDYRKPGAPGYFGYFGAAAGDPAKGYYSFDVGTWHIVALNGVCAASGGCEAGSAQEQWLRADLAAHPSICTLAYWYQPRFSSGHVGNHRTYDAFWRDLYRADADVVLNSDDQDYERFAPQTPKAVADPAAGIREFVVGTGGIALKPLATPQMNSEARADFAFGVLQLALHPTSYDWRFAGEPGVPFADTGSYSCH